MAININTRIGHGTIVATDVSATINSECGWYSAVT